ncbi:MAG: hypothetical protein KDB88_04150 [Flavobacteriales bacterium]|nr:hypothetical protein [Flavobacteriales bacterium]
MILVILVPALWVPGPGRSPDPGPLGTMLLFRPFEAWFLAFPWAAWITGVAITLGSAIWIDVLANRVELFERRNHLPALLFPIVLSMAPGGASCDPALLGMPFVVFALGRIWSIQGKMRAFAAIFDAGSLIGISALFYLPYAFLLVVLLASVSVMRSFSLREFLTPLLGFSTVLFLAWMFGALFLGPGHVLDPSISSLPLPAQERVPQWLLIAAALVFLPFLFYAVVSFSTVYGRSVMSEKNLRSSILALLAASIPIVVFELFTGGRFPMALVALPMSLFLTYPFQLLQRTWLAELILLAMLATAGMMRWMA